MNWITEAKSVYSPKAAGGVGPVVLKKEAGLTPDGIIPEYYLQIDRRDIMACLHDAAGLIRDADYVRFESSAG
ncbi:MAG: hypothetical protein ACLQBD_30915 [Syntrophobacteraceae bacterium]